MNHRSSTESQPAVLSRLLAELVNRLRLSHVEPHQHQRSWPVCYRLGVQADLLAGLDREAGIDDLNLFAQSLSDLAALGRDEPNQIPQAWFGALDRLAVFLDEMMVGLDAGDTPDQWLEDPHWERLTSWFANLESPFLVLDELEEILRRWQDSWCDGSLDPQHEAELHARWNQLRDFGDALFKSASDEEGASLLQWKGFSP